MSILMSFEIKLMFVKNILSFGCEYGKLITVKGVIGFLDSRI